MATAMLSAAPSPAGGAADLVLRWSAETGQAPRVRLVRRRWNHPVSARDGCTLFDTADLFADATGAPWPRVDIERFLVDNPRAEAGAARAEIVRRFTAIDDDTPAQIAVRISTDAETAMQEWLVDEVSRIDAVNGADGDFARIVTLTLFATPGGGAETVAGTLVIASEPTSASAPATVIDYAAVIGGGETPETIVLPGPPASRLTWTPQGGGAVATAFGRRQELTTTAETLAPAPLHARFTTSIVGDEGRGALPLAVTDAGDGAPVTIVTVAPHGLPSGALVSIAGAKGNTAANGTWRIRVLAADSFELIGATGNGAYRGSGIAFPPIVRTIDHVEQPDPLALRVERTMRIVDAEPSQPRSSPAAGLEGGDVHYYGAFVDDGAGFAAAGSASLLATAGYGTGERLFTMLPAAHRYYDDPASGQQGSWQLRRFVGIFGAALDQARGLAAALPRLRDPLEAPADYLPHLGQQIGWVVDRALPTERQRSDLLFAPDVYATIGTAANLQALATRGSGWACTVKEFVGNVLHTNAPEPLRLWQIFDAERASPGAALSEPALQSALYPLASEAAVTLADPARIDAKPAAVAAADGTIWLFWHSTRTGAEWQPATAYAAGALLAPLAADGLVYECIVAGISGAVSPAFPAASGAEVSDGGARWTCRGPGTARRRVWLQRLGVDTVPTIVDDGPTDAAPGFDEAPAAARRGGDIWLAWASSDGGDAGIWVRVWPSGASAPGAARRVTPDMGDCRNPALTSNGSATAALTLVWEASRDGRTALWISTSGDGGVTWSRPAAVTAGPRDRSPAVALDGGGGVTIFWSTDSGVASRIRRAVPAPGGRWTVSDVTPAEPFVIDRAPAAALWNGTLRLFWQSDRITTPWRPATVYPLGAYVTPIAANGSWYECVAAGSSGAAPPDFPVGAGARVSDGTAAWLCGGTIASRPAGAGRIWSADGPGFGNRAAVFPRLANDGEPAVVVTSGGALRLFFASQEKARRHVSRTFDTRFAPAGDREAAANRAAKAAMGTIPDRLHYTYDCRRAKDALASRETVGLYLTPADGASDADHDAAVERLRSYLAPFRPVSTRVVYLVRRAGGDFASVAVDP